MVHYSPPQLRYLKDPADLAALLAEDAASAARAAVVAVTFGPNFDVRDEHVQRLLAALGPQLRSIRLGSSDTGHGTWLTDAAVHAVVAACGPNLQVLYLESCTSVTDKAFLAAVEGLPNLQVLGVTGHDRSIGARGGREGAAPQAWPAVLWGLQEISRLAQRGAGSAATATPCAACRSRLTRHVWLAYPRLSLSAGKITKKALAPLLKGALPQASRRPGPAARTA